MILLFISVRFGEASTVISCDIKVNSFNLIGFKIDMHSSSDAVETSNTLGDIRIQEGCCGDGYTPSSCGLEELASYYYASNIAYNLY